MASGTTLNQRGFTLIELMITVAVVAILAAIAVPSFNSQIRKSRRAEVLSHLQQVALLQEKFRSLNSGFTSDWAQLGGNPDTAAALSGTVGQHYDWAISGTPGGFTITATAQGGQANDKQTSTTCSPLSITNAGVKSPAACWTR